jgi:hypothetical protein
MIDPDPAIAYGVAGLHAHRPRMTAPKRRHFFTNRSSFP